MSQSGPVRYQFDSSLRGKPIQRLLDLLCSDNAVTKTAPGIGDAIWKLHWCLANHPSVSASDLVGRLLDSDDWIQYVDLETEDQRRYQELRAFLREVIAPAAATEVPEPDSETDSDGSVSDSDESDVSSTPSRESVRSKLLNASTAFRSSIERAHVTMLAFGLIALFSSMCSLGTAVYLDRCDSDSWNRRL